MPQRLHYYAQPFWDHRREPARRYEFVCALDAEEGGEILAKLANGVLVYQQWVDADLGQFDEIEVLAKHGRVPGTATDIEQNEPHLRLDDIAYFKIECTDHGDTWTQIDPNAERQNGVTADSTPLPRRA